MADRGPPEPIGRVVRSWVADGPGGRLRQSQGPRGLRLGGDDLLHPLRVLLRGRTADHRHAVGGAELRVLLWLKNLSIGRIPCRFDLHERQRHEPLDDSGRRYMGAYRTGKNAHRRRDI